MEGRMAAKPLTDSAVKNLRPQHGQTGWRDVYDGGARGLRIRVSPTGQKVWMVQLVVGKKPDGKPVRASRTLGAYPEVTVGEARKRAAQFVAAAKDGHRPDYVEARERAQHLTISEAHAEYVAAVEKDLKPQTVALKRALCRDHIAPSIGNRKLANIRRADVVEAVEAVRAKGKRVQSNRVFSEIMALLRWCEQRQYIDGVPSFNRFKAKERPRDRTLSEDELAAVWKATGAIGDMSGAFAKLVLLTGQRRDEVRLMRWSEVSLNRAVWVIPGSRYKTGQDHVIPLSPQAVAVLQDLKERAPAGAPYVLPARDPAQPFNGALSALRRLRKAAGTEHFTLHDLRRTLRTGLSRLGVDDRTAELVIGHTPQGMHRVYDRYERIEERRDALRRWADYVERVAQPESNVVSLQSA
jgi:integrase